MKGFVSTIAGALLALAVVLVLGSGTALAEELVTITGQVVLAEEDAEGKVTVTIVTETDTYIVTEDSKVADLAAQSGKKVTAKGAIEATEMGKKITVQEYALVEADTPPVGAQD